MTSGDPHAFQNAPREVGAPGHGMEESSKHGNTANIHSDYRIHRGNTYANLQEGGPEPGYYHSPSKLIKRRKKEVTPSPFQMPLPKPLRLPVFLSEFLEEQNVFVPILANVASLTKHTPRAHNEALPKSEAPPDESHIPPKCGIDASTMTEAADQHLLKGFDHLVTPIIEIMATRVMDQALMEVYEEAEMACIEEFKKGFDKRVVDDMAECKREKDVEANLYAEDRARKVEAYKRYDEFQERSKRIAAVMASRQYVGRLIPNTLWELSERGYFSRDMAAIDCFNWCVAESCTEKVLERPNDLIIENLCEKVAEGRKQRRRDAIAMREAIKEKERQRIASLHRSMVMVVEESPADSEDGPVPVNKDVPFQFRIDESWEKIRTNMRRALRKCGVKLPYPHGVEFYQKSIEKVPIDESDELEEKEVITVFEDGPRVGNAKGRVLVRPGPPPPPPE